MSVMLKNGSVFLHIPKTGGKWIENALDELSLKKYKFSHNHADMDRTVNFAGHYPTYFMRKIVKHGPFVHRNIRDAFKFCFVRHPLKYYESYFKYAWSLDWPEFPGLDVHSKTDKWHPNSVLFDIGDKDFNQFIRNVIKKRPGYVTELYGSFATPDIDFIGKTENLVEDFINVLHLMKVDFDEQYVRDLKPVNVSKKPSNPIKWDPKLKEEILKIEYPALVKYGYVDADID